jgi:hypothetical protein
LFGEAAVETGHGWTRILFSVRDDAELYGLLDQIQDFALHLVSLEEVGSTAAAPDEKTA